ncbi:GAF and ANTAR domain-containing protein [Lentzea kentuckyensis]|uniref:GAF and ANTAR domain-containing protein n=1 Tax=Lentzea kentuckyensis TaxID=360086 RepID=UPI000A39B33A|nr:GAF and ANTAR domain-containing protein [Lentzea kentuckyensis]
MADDTRTFSSSHQSLNGDRPDVLERLDEAADALEVLRDALSGEESLDDALQRLAETATKAIPDADAVTVSVMTLQQPRTAASTDHLLVDVDEKQYSADRGPCLQSARTLQAVRAVVGEHREEWPEFEAAAAEHDIRAYLSVPVILPATGRTQAEHVGSLNIYSHTAAAFDPFDEGLMRLFTTAASATISSAQRWQRSREHIQQLERALVSRAVIDQAKGILMAVNKCTPDEAFAMLVERSQYENVKLRDVAKNLLDSVMRS